MNRRIVLAGVAATCLAPAAMSAQQTAHDFTFANIDGGQHQLAAFAGRPILVVNTASQCGFTPQYNGLQSLYDTYRGRGLVVLAVPSDDFGGQEFSTEAEVKKFCEVNFGLDFPMTEITKVRGADAHPFYAWARESLGRDRAPRWNFHKYLVAPDGSLAGAFTHQTRPEDAVLVRAVEDLLN